MKVMGAGAERKVMCGLQEVELGVNGSPGFGVT